MQQLTLNKGDRVGLISCSDGSQRSDGNQLESIVHELTKWGLGVDLATTIYRKNGPFSGTPKARATELNRFFSDKKIKAIFDISGGDSANQILPYLDFNLIRENAKAFFGYSDVSVLLNSLYKCAGYPTYHYQLRHIIYDETGTQKDKFYQTFFSRQRDLFQYDYRFLRGTAMSGTVIGGNIRCFLKLAGTSYLPRPEGKVIFLESYGGGVNRIASLFAQLEQMDYLRRCSGILLGTFTQLERDYACSQVEEFFLELTSNQNISVAKTDQLGHDVEASAIVIGEEVKL